MLFFRLNRFLPNEREAFAALQAVAGFSPSIVQRRFPTEDGSSYRNRYALMVPAGRRPEGLLKQMSLQLPAAQWTLVDVDSDGYETPVAPAAQPLERQL